MLNRFKEIGKEIGEGIGKGIESVTSQLKSNTASSNTFIDSPKPSDFTITTVTSRPAAPSQLTTPALTVVTQSAQDSQRVTPLKVQNTQNSQRITPLEELYTVFEKKFGEAVYLRNLASNEMRATTRTINELLNSKSSEDNAKAAKLLLELRTKLNEIRNNYESKASIKLEAKLADQNVRLEVKSEIAKHKAKLENEIAEDKAELTKLKSDIAEYKVKLVDAESRLADAHTHNKVLKQKIDDQAIEQDRLENDLINSKEQIKQAIKSRLACEKHNKELTTERDKAIDEKRKLKAKVLDVEDKLQDYRSPPMIKDRLNSLSSQFDEEPAIYRRYTYHQKIMSIMFSLAIFFAITAIPALTLAGFESMLILSIICASLVVLTISFTLTSLYLNRKTSQHSNEKRSQAKRAAESIFGQLFDVDQSSKILTKQPTTPAYVPWPALRTIASPPIQRTNSAYSSSNLSVVATSSSQTASKNPFNNDAATIDKDLVEATPISQTSNNPSRDGTATTAKNLEEENDPNTIVNKLSENNDSALDRHQPVIASAELTDSTEAQLNLNLRPS